MFRNISLTYKMLLITIVVGVSTWSFLDPIQSRTIEKVFHQQIAGKLVEEANENLMLFDRYVQIFHQNVKLIILQKEFYDYIHEVKDTEWSPLNNSFRIKSYTHYMEYPEWRPVRDDKNRIKSYAYYMEYPRWMPASSILRSFTHFHYALLADSMGNVREIYKNFTQAPPPPLLEPAQLLKQLRSNSILLTRVDGTLNLVASESLYDQKGKLLSTLLMTSPVDNEFLDGSQDKYHIVAFAEGEDRKIIASNRSDLLPAGAGLESLGDRYLYSTRRVNNYGADGLKLELVVLMPRMPLEQISKSVLSKERGNRIITALLLILTFSFIMVWITKRIKALTGRVLDFSQQSTDLRRKDSPEGDELKVLDVCFRNLTKEIALSHESLRKHAESLQKERDRAQNYLDVAGTIILTLDPGGKVTMINRTGCILLGYDEKEIVGKDWFDNFIPEKTRSEIKEVFGKIMTGEAGAFGFYENTVLNRDGVERLVAWHNTILKDESGNITGALSSGEDITEHKQLEKSLIGIEERERRRIGQDLHDGLGQLLTGVAFKLRGLGRKLEKSSFSNAEDAAEISALVDEAKKQVSRISRGLYPAEMDKEGLMSALDQLADYTRKTFGIPCMFICNEPVSILNKTAVLQLYRIAQEAITNAVKHGEPAGVELSLSSSDGKIVMTVTDNGKGIPDISGRSTAGMGLKIMSYRASLINASLEIKQGTGGGTVVTCAFSDATD